MIFQFWKQKLRVLRLAMLDDQNKLTNPKKRTGEEDFGIKTQRFQTCY